MGAFTFSRYRQQLIGNRGGLVIFLVALLCTVVFVRISYADGAKITAMRIHHHATTKKTRLTVEFNQKVAYEQIPGVMLIEFKLLNTALSDFDLPQVQSSDPIQCFGEIRYQVPELPVKIGTAPIHIDEGRQHRWQFG